MATTAPSRTPSKRRGSFSAVPTDPGMSPASSDRQAGDGIGHVVTINPRRRERGRPPPAYPRPGPVLLPSLGAFPHASRRRVPPQLPDLCCPAPGVLGALHGLVDKVPGCLQPEGEDPRPAARGQGLR